MLTGEVQNAIDKSDFSFDVEIDGRVSECVFVRFRTRDKRKLGGEEGVKLQGLEIEKD